MTRQGWKDGAQYLYLQDPSSIVMVTPEKRFQPMWPASQEDLLADDWVVATPSS